MGLRRAVFAIATSAGVIASIGCAAIACSQAYAAADPAAADAAANPSGDGASVPDAPVASEASAPDGASDAALAPVTVLAAGYSIISAIAADDTDVYFADQATGLVHSVPIVGGTVRDLVQGGSPTSLALSRGFVYWTDTAGGTVSMVATAGGASATKAATRSAPARALTITSDRVIVVFGGNGVSTQLGEIVPYSLDLVVQTAGVISPVQSPYSITSNDTQFFWTEVEPSDTIASGIVGSNLRTAVASMALDAQSIAADATHLFWTNSAAGTIYVKTGAAAVPLATGQQNPRSLASDGKFLYWISEDGFLRRTDVANTGMPTTVASGFAAPLTLNFRALALTSTYVVWFTEDGRVLRIAK